MLACMSDAAPAGRPRPATARGTGVSRAFPCVNQEHQSVNIYVTAEKRNAATKTFNSTDVAAQHVAADPVGSISGVPPPMNGSATRLPGKSLSRKTGLQRARRQTRLGSRRGTGCRAYARTIYGRQ